MQNKPNFRELAGRRNTQHSTILSFHHSSPCLLCKTKPISGSPAGTGGRNVRNKPNSSQMGRKGKYRTEQELQRTKPARDPGETKPIRGHRGWARPERRGAIAPNKPNFGERTGWGQRPRGTNKANLPPGGREDHRRPEALAMPRRKGNCVKQTQFHRRVERVKSFVGKDLW